MGLGRSGVPGLPERYRRLQHRALPPAGGGRGARPGGAAAARVQPVHHRADDQARAAPERTLARRWSVLLQLRRGGQRGRAEARAQAPARGRGPRRARRVPRPDLRCAERDAAGGKAGALRAAGPGVPRARCRRPRRFRRREHRRRPRGARPGGVGRPSAQSRDPARPAYRVRPPRRAADTRRGPVRDGADRDALGMGAGAGAPGCDDPRQGPRGRAAHRRAGLHPRGLRRP